MLANGDGCFNSTELATITFCFPPFIYFNNDNSHCLISSSLPLYIFLVQINEEKTYVFFIDELQKWNNGRDMSVSDNMN